MNLSAAQQQHILETLRAFQAKIRSLVGSFKKETIQLMDASDDKKEEAIRAKILAS